MATLLYPGREFRITHQEMIKGIGRGSGKPNLRYYDELVVPIIENTPEERDLTVCWSRREKGKKCCSYREVYITLEYRDYIDHSVAIIVTLSEKYFMSTSRAVTHAILAARYGGLLYSALLNSSPGSS